MNKTDLNIIIVGYNEESNLPKCFKYLEYLRSKINCRIIYVDQSSEDKSVEIANKNWAEIYVHPNKWYADPDKKWAVEELCEKEEWCMILDCDEELTKGLSDKIYSLIKENRLWFCYSIVRNTYWMWIVVAKTYQLRIFKKEAVNIDSTIHDYIRPKNKNKHLRLKEGITEIDLKYQWKEFEFIVSKFNKYSSIEADQLYKTKQYNLFLIYFFVLTKPIIRFFWIYFLHLNFLKWWRWLFNSLLMWFYQFLIYSKIYEKKQKN